MKSWKGVAFEEVCWQHNTQIKRALEIGGVKSSLSAWSVKGDEENEGAQIDLLINRADNVVNLCEMKFCGGEYVISKDEESKLRNRIEMLKKTLSPKQTVHLRYRPKTSGYGRSFRVSKQYLTFFNYHE